MKGLLILMVAAAIAHGAPALDYHFFKERVQPILLKKRPGHARCVTWSSMSRGGCASGPWE